MTGVANARARVELRIRGRVQGVSFRAWAQAEARRLGLLGWVRNEADGSVRALAEGPRDALERFVALCHSGPPAARVDDVQAGWSSPQDDLEPFSVRRME